MIKRTVLATVMAVLSHTSAHAAANDTVTVVVPDSIDNLDPCRTARNDVGRVIKQNVVETLTQLNPADGKVMPRLATRWEENGAGICRRLPRCGSRSASTSGYR